MGRWSYIFRADMKTWQVIESQVLLDRRPWLRVIGQDVRLANGRTIEGYLLAETREWAMVFALCDDGRVPLVRQYKHGVRGPVYDLPAGYLDGDEEPLVCAQRELLEETGYAADEWRHLSSALLDSNRSRARAHLFLARGARQIAPPHLDETEDLETLFFAPAQLWGMVRSGEIVSIGTVACVLLALDALNLRE
jgi:ADP-ribose pyrophosphatase